MSRGSEPWRARVQSRPCGLATAQAVSILKAATALSRSSLARTCSCTALPHAVYNVLSLQRHSISRRTLRPYRAQAMGTGATRQLQREPLRPCPLGFCATHPCILFPIVLRCNLRPAERRADEQMHRSRFAVHGFGCSEACLVRGQRYSEGLEMLGRCRRKRQLIAATKA